LALYVLDGSIFWVLDFWVLGSGNYFEFPITPFLSFKFPRTLTIFTEPKKTWVYVQAQNITPQNSGLLTSKNARKLQVI
jgi:hypothetical protein